MKSFVVVGSAVALFLAVACNRIGANNNSSCTEANKAACCNTKTKKAEEAFIAKLQTSDRSCTVDGDCSTAKLGPDCGFACTPPVAVAASQVSAIEARLNADADYKAVCADRVNDSVCLFPMPGCVSVPPRCVAGQCEFGS